jgi:hypothetical protein
MRLPNDQVQIAQFLELGRHVMKKSHPEPRPIQFEAQFVIYLIVRLVRYPRQNVIHFVVVSRGGDGRLCSTNRYRNKGLF